MEPMVDSSLGNSTPVSEGLLRTLISWLVVRLDISKLLIELERTLIAPVQLANESREIEETLLMSREPASSRLGNDKLSPVLP